MSLDGFSVQNVGGIETANCDDIPQLMVIAGPNGVGKSTLLENINTEVNQDGSDVEASNDTDIIYFSPHRAPNPGTLSASALSSLPNQSARGLLGGSDYQLGGDNSDIPNDLRHGYTRKRDQADYAPYFEVKKRLAQFEYQKGNILSEVYEELNEVPQGHIPDFDKPLQSGIEAVLPGVKYEGVELVDNEFQIIFRNRTGDNIGFDELSSGEKDAITMLFLLLEKQIENLVAEVRETEPEEEELVVLIDSPESHLHPAMQDRFFNYLQDVLESSQGENLNLQVILSTHSQSILNNSSMSNLYLLMYADQRGGNQLVHADGIERGILNEFLGDLGVSALSAGKPLLLVEGKTDKDIFTRLNPDLDVHFEITPMGGKGDVQNANETFSELSAELSPLGIDVFSIVDSDRNDVDDPSGPFYPLPRTCLENFLLGPDVLYDGLSTLVPYETLRSEDIQSSDDVDDLISNLIEQESFRTREIKTRLSENMAFYVNLGHMDEISVERIESEIDDVTSTKKERIRDQLSDVERSVDQAIESRELDNLNGKIIFSGIASEFDMKPGPLKRVVAEKMNNGYDIPSDLDSILSDLFESIG